MGTNDPDNDGDDDTNDPRDTQDTRVGMPIVLAQSSRTRDTSHAKANRSNVSHAHRGVKRHKKP